MQDRLELDVAMFGAAAVGADDAHGRARGLRCSTLLDPGDSPPGSVHDGGGGAQ